MTRIALAIRGYSRMSLKQHSATQLSLKARLDAVGLSREPEAAVKAAGRHRRGRAAEEVRGARGPLIRFGTRCLLRRGSLRFGRSDLLAFSCWLGIALRGGSACGFRMPGACSCCGRRGFWLRSLRTRSARLGALSLALGAGQVANPSPRAARGGCCRGYLHLRGSRCGRSEAEQARGGEP